MPRERRRARRSGPAWAWWLAKLGLSVVALQRLQKAARLRAVELLSRFGPGGRRGIVWLAQGAYLAAVFEVLLFRRHLLEAAFPQAIKLLRRVDMEAFVEADQTQPCKMSHPHVSCGDNAKRLWSVWWRRVPTAYVAVQFLLHAVARRRSLSSFFSASQLGDMIRTVLFFFGSTGLPGYVWCLTKQWSPDGRGTRFPGLLVTSAVGALATLFVRSEKSVSLVTSLYVGSALALVWSQLRRRSATSP